MKSSPKEKLINLFARVRYGLARSIKNIKESSRLSEYNLRWIAAASLFIILLFAIGYLIFLSDSIALPLMLPVALMVVSLPLLMGALFRIGQSLIPIFPLKSSWLLVSGIAVVVMYSNTSPKGALLQILYYVFTFVFIFTALSNLIKGNWSSLRKIQKLLTVFFLVIGIANLGILIFFLIYPGPPAQELKDFSLEAKYLPEHIPLPDPGAKGKNSYAYFTYGSGDDRQREEFASEVTLTSKKVDGSSFISDWDKLSGKLRTRYWGFGPDSLPLNGRCWIPEGEGPFPICLVVHGNHLDRDFSDTGYAYIGKHLASHGNICISIDENFLNGGIFDFKHPLKAENDARGWLLLKHLEQLQEWNTDSSTLLFNKADLENVILIGHSRGGEAVCIASSFNELDYYPDNANETFDFHFGIKGLVSIAQIDGQYKPSDKPTPLENVNYILLHGSRDADLTSLSGIQQMNRIRFSDSLYHFKTGIYIRNANHGQFNTSWGKNDIGYPRGLLLNRKAMLAKEDQEKIALIYIQAFVKACLEEESRYIDLFKDYRAGKNWLPATLYFNQFQDSDNDLFADYEEDIDIGSSSDENVKISFELLSKINERKIPLRWGNSGSTGVFIGWNNEEDSIPGNYGFEFEEPVNLEKLSYQSIVFDVIPLDEDPGSRPGESSLDSLDIQTGADSLVLSESDDEKENEEEKAVSFQLCMIDTDGDSATISLGDYVPLNYVSNDRIYKLSQLSKDQGAEKVPRSVNLDIQNFREANPAFDDPLKKLVFIFSEGKKGMLILDNIGFSQRKQNSF